MQNFVELPKEKLNIPFKEINQTKLDLDIDDFYNNDVILISSGTATGKTRAIAKISKDLKTKYNSNILSIVNLITLSREQRYTFQEISEICLSNYQTSLNDFKDSDGVICLNSLYKLENIEDFDASNTILYIDEVNDLIRSLTHNDGLDNVLNMVYTFLIKLIKTCKKIILSDATIDLNTLNLLSSRIVNNKSILIKNTIQKFKGVKAKKYNNENEFLKVIIQHIKNKNYFLFGCDGCEKITEFYKNILEKFPDQKDAFILFTGKTINEVEDAMKQFKNKYVFYSPTITTGVSFILEDIKQTHFIYLTNRPLITPISLYQMSCRTRNMKELIYYTNDIKPKDMKHETLKEVENKYKKMIKYNNRLLNMSKSINENDDVKIVENTFFKLFCYNEYQTSIFNTGFVEHYENILIRDGFELEEVGDKAKLDKEIQKEFKELYEVVKDEQFESFINLNFNIQDERDFEEVKKQYPILYNRTDILNIQTKEEAEKYKIFLMDEYSLKNYFNLLNLFKTDKYITVKNKVKSKETFKIKSISTVFNKLLLIKQFETHYKIDRFHLNFDDIDITNEISNHFQELYKNVFSRQTDKQFKTKEQIFKIYYNMLKNIYGDIPVIIRKNVKQNNKQSYKYLLNTDCLKDIITLAKNINPTLINYNIELIEKLTGIKPDPKPKGMYISDKDEDDVLVNYNFNIHTFKQNHKESITKFNSPFDEL